MDGNKGMIEAMLIEKKAMETMHKYLKKQRDTNKKLDGVGSWMIGALIDLGKRRIETLERSILEEQQGNKEGK